MSAVYPAAAGVACAGAGLVIAVLTAPARPRTRTGRDRPAPRQLDWTIDSASADFTAHHPQIRPAVMQFGPDWAHVYTEAAPSKADGEWVALSDNVFRRAARPLPVPTAAPRSVLVTVGRAGDDDVLIDVAAAGRVALAGDPAEVAWFVAHVISELRWPADEGEIDLVTADAPSASPATVGEVPSLAVGSDAISVTAADDEGSSSPWTVTLSAGEVRLDPLGLCLEPVHLPPPPTRVDEDPLPVASGNATTPPGVRVAVLGPVDITGTLGELRPRAAELVAYLAVHTLGVTAEQLRTALWPDRVASRGTFNNLVTEARRALGVNANGEPLLRLVGGGGRYRLDPDVTCDLVELEAALEKSRGAPDVDRLRAGLASVRGRPFDGWLCEWLFDETVVARAEVAVSSAAHRLADAATAARDLALARWAVARGLAAVHDPALRDRVDAPA